MLQVLYINILMIDESCEWHECTDVLCVRPLLLYTLLNIFSPIFILLWRSVLLWGTYNQVEELLLFELKDDIDASSFALLLLSFLILQSLWCITLDRLFITCYVSLICLDYFHYLFGVETFYDKMMCSFLYLNKCYNFVE